MRLSHSMLILLLSHTALLQRKPLLQRNHLLQFSAMILCAQPDSLPILDYIDYGCFCGLGGSGTPVDDLDKCCEVHDQCYGDALQHDDCVPVIDNPYTNVYSYRCDKANKIFTCLNDNNSCEKFICECDRNAAMCFAKADYNEGNKHLPSERCT